MSDQNQLVDIERAISQLALSRSRLAVEKTAHQLELSRLNERVRGKGYLPPKEYDAIVRKQGEVKGRIRENESLMAELKNQIREKEMLKASLKADMQQGAMTPEVIGSLRILREKYVSFAADATRVSSMRQMAAQFVQELDLIANAE